MQVGDKVKVHRTHRYTREGEIVGISEFIVRLANGEEETFKPYEITIIEPSREDLAEGIGLTD